MRHFHFDNFFYLTEQQNFIFNSEVSQNFMQFFTYFILFWILFLLLFFS